MSEPVVHAIAVVLNEADIIRLCLEHAARFCRNVWVLEHDSDDGTWEIVEKAAAEIEPVVAFERRTSPYWGRGLHGHVFHSVGDAMTEGDWVMILDADEFQESDPRPALGRAAARGCDTVQCLQAQFVVTESDLDAEWFTREVGPVTDFSQLPAHYRIDWMETRFFRFRRDLVWPALQPDGVTPHMQYLPSGVGPPCSIRLLNRHYQYRSRRQMEQRVQQRAAEHAQTGLWGHSCDADWRKYVQSPGRLERLHPGEGVRRRPWTVPYVIWRQRKNRWRRRLRSVLRR